MDRVLVILGPTAVGKTALSLALAEYLQGEIISADSMQVYRGMDIGTAKPNLSVQECIPHHLIDIMDPTEPFSVGMFQERARASIRAISKRGRLPIVVGGTGLYLRALLYDFPLADVPGDPEFRNAMAEAIATKGLSALHSRLQSIDPVSAARIHSNDEKRIVRALEVHYHTGSAMSKLLAKTREQPVFDVYRLGLSLPRSLLYQRINQRVDQMMQEGWVDEIHGLLAYYGQLGPTASQALGYREILQTLRVNGDWEPCVRSIKQKTRHFAKRQLTWFRREADVFWVDVRRDPLSDCCLPIAHWAFPRA